MAAPPVAIHVSKADGPGGADVAASRLVAAQAEIAPQTEFIVRSRINEQAVYREVHPHYARVVRVVDRYVSGATNAGEHGHRSANLLPTGMARVVNCSDAAIANLHWLGSGTMSIRDVGRIQKAIVWTLHDMWPLTGTEHYEADIRPRSQQDTDAADRFRIRLSDLAKRRKARHWPHDIVYVAPSSWMARQVARSAIGGESRVEVIPNPVPLGVFRPNDAVTDRHALRLPYAPLLIGFGAHNAGRDPRKGWDLLRRALRYVRSDAELAVFGSDVPLEAERVVHSVGTLASAKEVASFYSAVDVCVVPSRLDNLPQTATEAQACGTPLVAFDVGGLRDTVSDQTGYIATPFDVRDLARGINGFLDYPDRRVRAGQMAVDRARRLWSESHVASQYFALYSSVLAERERAFSGG